VTELEDLCGARYRLAQIYANSARALADAIEREREADVLSHGLAINAAWEAFCKTDQKYWAARREEGT
jgi:hypothetical protein